MTKNWRSEPAFNFIVLLLALWLMVAPQTFGFLSQLAASLNAWFSGVTVAVLVVAGLVAVVDPRSEHRYRVLDCDIAVGNRVRNRCFCNVESLSGRACCRGA
jgi:hypothetical protein